MTRAHEVLLAVHRPGSGGVEFLVLKRSPWKQGYWHLAGGGVEEGESLSQAAARELAEETKLSATALVDLGGELGYDGVQVHAFSVEAPAGWEPTLDEEHDAYRWCSLAEAEGLLAYEEPREVLRRAARRLGESG